MSEETAPDGMRIDWDVPITVDDGLVLRADVFRPDDGERYPVIVTYGPYAKGLHFEDGYPDQWHAMCAEHPDVAAGLEQPLPGLGAARPREMGAARLRVPARGFPRRRELARGHRPVLGARDAGLLPLHRVGRGAAMEQRQDRPERDFLLRDQPVAGRRAAPAASGGDLCLGGRRRLVPRLSPPRRDPLHLLRQLVSTSGRDRPARGRRARRTQPRDRCAGRPASRRSRRRSWPPTASTSAPRCASMRWSTTTSPRGSPTSPGSRCPFCRPATGAATASICGATPRASCGPARSSKWLEIHGLAHWTHYYTDYGREIQRQFLDHFLKDADNGWDERPRGVAEHPPRRRNVRPAGRAGVADRADAVDEAPPRRGQPIALAAAGRRGSDVQLPGHGRTA